MNPVQVLIRKELKVEFRSLQGLVASAMLSFMILMSLRFSVVDSIILQNSGILWASILLTGLGLVTHISTRESERGTVDLLKLAPITRYQLFLGRMVGSLVLLWILSTITLVIYVILFGNPFAENLLLAYLIVLIGCTGLSAVGTLAASSAIPILLFTVIEAAIRSTDSLITGSSDFELAFMLLVMYNVAFVTGGAWLSEISD